MMGNKSGIYIPSFFKHESASGVLLLLAAAIAILLANTPFSPYYDLLLGTPVEIRIGAFEIAKPLLLWINDGLMAVFFFLVGLELKREFLEGELSSVKNIVLPGMGAIGGMFIPALIYIYINKDNTAALQGWAIPAATDIAFALGILALLGSRVPTSLKVFLTSVAIFDDVGAIIIIAIFYTVNISIISLVVSAFCILILFWLNRRNILSISIYIVIGVIMWASLLKSGVHATLSGVILAAFIPMQSRIDSNYSPLKSLENDLHSIVAYFILPLFAFANAGINLTGIGIQHLLHSVPLGIALGLFLGKQFGIFFFCWITIKLGLANLPRDISWTSLYGVAALCGIGFTMSLFIGSLAFEETGLNIIFDERLGILIGSLLSGTLGYLILRLSLVSNNKNKIYQ
jgi:NhaA family Na+:H+ antiporter